MTPTIERTDSAGEWKGRLISDFTQRVDAQKVARQKQLHEDRTQAIQWFRERVQKLIGVEILHVDCEEYEYYGSYEWKMRTEIDGVTFYRSREGRILIESECPECGEHIYSFELNSPDDVGSCLVGGNTRPHSCPKPKDDESATYTPPIVETTEDRLIAAFREFVSDYIQQERP